ncbi:MAG: 1-deoxy-D-xylulose-5-phosphate reductoisomerase [Ruminococcaceae bacterium]|nr:1-deoxy-D-xylulose-5-phosphate reductoisomerase [Oscillospiraceae bacterium]
MKNISILGSTGSIGTQALEVADICGDVCIKGLSANSNVELLEKQIRKYRPEKACIMNEKLYPELKNKVSDTSTKIVSGIEGLCEVACINDTESVLTSVVGNIGLLPTVEAINAGKNILLANKETLVTAGSIIMPMAKEKNIKILPVDSEHSAIFQCIQGAGDNKISKILLTASGGPFFGMKKEELKTKRASDALKHPNWTMGAKITIDSSTLMNKGLEVIEACWLFDVSYEKIEVYVHRQSIVHSMVEFEDNSVIAQLGIPDMKLPIVYAINYPKRKTQVSEKLNLFEVGTLTFEKADTETFECLSLAYRAIREGGTMPAVMNAANEIAVEKFLLGEIGFLDIPEIIKQTMNAHTLVSDISISDIQNADTWAREYGKTL